MNPKETIQTLVTQGKLQEALSLLLSCLVPQDPFGDTARLLHARYNQIEQAGVLGQLTPAQKTAEINRLTMDTLVALRDWEPGGDSSGLHAALKKLGLTPDEPIGALHLVNVDRTRQAKMFRREFNKKGEAPGQSFQFYFICGCPDEMPGSFAKRLVYELIRDKLDNQNDRISFPFREDADCLKLEEMPLGDDLESSKKRFKAYVAKRFRFTDSQRFETFVETGLPKLHFDYVTAVFELSEKQWDGDEGEIRDYLRWMMDTFRCAHPDVPTFLFFIVLKSPRLYGDPEQRTARQRQMVTDLETLCADKPAETALFLDFPPVEAADFSDWLSALGAQNPNQADAVIDALVRSLRPEDRALYDREEKFHMKDLETVQRMIYELVSK